jgi:hypothetical protein
MTGIARYIFFDLDIFADAPGDLLVTELYFDPKITAANTLGPGMPATPSSAKEASEDIIPENIPELAEDIFHVHSATAKATPSVIAQTGMPEPVVFRPLLTVAQHFVCFRRFFEFFFRNLVARIAVGMKFHGHLAVAPLYFIVRSRFGNL